MECNKFLKNLPIFNPFPDPYFFYIPCHDLQVVGQDSHWRNKSLLSTLISKPSYRGWHFKTSFVEVLCHFDSLVSIFVTKINPIDE